MIPQAHLVRWLPRRQPGSAQRRLRGDSRPHRAALTVVAAALWLGTPAWAQMPPPVSAQALAAAARNPVVVAGEAWIVEQTTALQSLRIEPGAAVAAPAGRSLTMTVDGVETGIKPGLYRGEVVLTVSEPHVVEFDKLHRHRFRQALFIDAEGVVAGKSVLAAAGPVRVADGVISGLRLRSVGDNFNGIVVAGGRWTLKDADIDFVGNGGNDFAGYGAAILSDGPDTTLVVDGARLRTHGAVRTAAVCNGGSNLVVKNSDLASRQGRLAADFVSNVTPGEMKDAPWMLGIRGNVRTTNVLGEGTTCTYIGSRLAADSWGLLSVDASRNTRLTAINSRIEVSGESGYGSYAIGNSTNAFYGSFIDVPTHGVIITGGHAVFAASRADTLQRLNSELKLGLGAQELAAMKPAQTIVNSQRYGVMSWGDATVKIADATEFNTGEAVFLNKGATVAIEVDGGGGAKLNSRNGVLFQAIDNDDPGPVMTAGLMANTGVYREPAGPPDKLAGFDLGAAHASDMKLRFAKIALKGDFYNAIRSMRVGGMFGPDGPSPGPTPGPNPGPPRLTGANLVLTLDEAQLSGVVSSANAHHLKQTIAADDYQWLGRVSNTPAPAVNNGVIVELRRSRWTVTGPSYLNRLSVGPGSQVLGPDGRGVAMTVDGRATELREGEYRGQIVLRPL